MCKVNVSTTLEEHSVYVEESADSNSLLCAVEGENPGPVERIAWHRYIRHHHMHSLHLQLPPGLPLWRLHQVERAFLWLVRKVFHEHDKKKVYP